ncbi:hypothetical protein QRD89_10995 [Halobacillus sp. ACCC02827]|uniref:hypothetical protein n=1 Tax=Bacillaceae TaxID=186817 RepID=UPI0002A50DD6|nr:MULTISPECIES: hypothetical protein [Bacillaceae]ELK44947.1 hypothetical protein D479_17309 [Halobacillus sp. BAB-2008]QHT47027.1 hypothetical protein M662_11165 [Bacillus sp. SB49]WJE14252.1 hypothetical protein QRD89_10995 [Halobacillus sp. ACCC02827]
MIWMLLLIPLVCLIGIALYFDKSKKNKTGVDNEKTYEEIYENKGAATKSADPKYTKNF